jgi:hypothetical protein
LLSLASGRRQPLRTPTTGRLSPTPRVGISGTAVNMPDDVLLELAERPNVVGVKDRCGSLAQSADSEPQTSEGNRKLRKSVQLLAGFVD